MEDGNGSEWMGRGSESAALSALPSASIVVDKKKLMWK